MSKMKLKKELVDEVIRITKKYYKTGDTDVLPALNKANDDLELKSKATSDVVELIEDLAMFAQRRGNVTYADIYKALEAFGIIVEEKEKENEIK